ncbi:MAG: cell division protein SepF [Propionibacteriaceae bacterium]|jgi:cell division inhibitor SepF|nr:cell division protein SepF [Propionibacteriaceae bacterium]
MAGLLSRATQWVFGPNPSYEEDDYFDEEMGGGDMEESGVMGINDTGELTGEATELVSTPVEEQSRSFDRRSVRSSTVTPIDSRRPRVVTQVPPDEIVHMHPKTFAEVAAIREVFAEGTPVILNLTNTDHAQGQRLIDFSAGMALITGGKLEPITQRVYLLTPARVKLTDLDKQEALAKGEAVSA